MAFYCENTNEPFFCLVCKKQVSKGKKLLKPYDCAVYQMCDSCFKECYEDFKINDIDNPTNVLTQMRNAEVLEKGYCGKDSEPEMGYEYALPGRTEGDVERDTLSWCGVNLFLTVLAFAVFNIFCESKVSIGFYLVFSSAVIFVSLMMIFRNIKDLVKFMHLGVSKERKKWAIFSMVLNVMMAAGFIIGIIINI